MKKLLILFLLGCCQPLLAQQVEKNSLSATFGPNWFFQYSELRDAEYIPKTGFSAGLDYTRSIARRWQLRLFGRYNTWNSVVKVGNLRWPSEYENGVYVPDPNLPHSITIDVTDKSWQLLAGVRYLGKPGLWRWYADAEVGITDYIEQAGSNAPLRTTIGLGAGMEWRPPGRHFGLFAQPVTRYIFKLPNHVVDNHFLSLTVECGVRLHF